MSIFSKDEQYSHWWKALPAIPAARESDAYVRLRHMWADKSQFQDKPNTDKRKHRFYAPTLETHLTATLWENFTLFSPGDWLSELASISGLPISPGKVSDCRWSYGWCSPKRPEMKPKFKITDLIIHFRTDGPGDGIIVVEAKRPGKNLKDKDLDPSYYLKIQELVEASPHRWLLYCVDQAEKVRFHAYAESHPEVSGCGIITWEELGGLQIKLARRLAVPVSVRTFIAGAIQYQYIQHDIIPTTLAADYLDDEPTVLDVDAGMAGPKVEGNDMIWKLP